MLFVSFLKSCVSFLPFFDLNSPIPSFMLLIFPLLVWKIYFSSIFSVVTLEISSRLLNSKSEHWPVSLDLSRVYKYLTALIIPLLVDRLLLSSTLNRYDFFYFSHPILFYTLLLLFYNISVRL